MQTCCLGCGPRQPYYLLIKGAFQLNWVVNVNITQGNGGIRKKPREQGVSQAAELKLEAISSNLSFGPLLFMVSFLLFVFSRPRRRGGLFSFRQHNPLRRKPNHSSIKKSQMQ